MGIEYNTPKQTPVKNLKTLMLSLRRTEFSVWGDEKFWRWTVLMDAQQCDCMKRRPTVHLKMAHFRVHLCCHNLKREI